MKVLRKFHKEASENQTNMKSAIENMKMLKKEATIVAEALENTMHQLPVHGAKVSYFQKFTRKFRNDYFLHIFVVFFYRLMSKIWNVF